MDPDTQIRKFQKQRPVFDYVFCYFVCVGGMPQVESVVVVVCYEFLDIVLFDDASSWSP
jgi:hypothetical protein